MLMPQGKHTHGRGTWGEHGAAAPFGTDAQSLHSANYFLKFNSSSRSLSTSQIPVTALMSGAPRRKYRAGPRGRHSQREVVEPDGAQREGPSQQPHVREDDADGLLEVRQLLQHWRRLDQLPVCVGLLDLGGGSEKEGALGIVGSTEKAQPCNHHNLPTSGSHRKPSSNYQRLAALQTTPRRCGTRCR